MTTITEETRRDLATRYALASGKGLTDVDAKSARKYFDKLERAGITGEILEDYFNNVVSMRTDFRNFYQDVLTAREINAYLKASGRPAPDPEPIETPTEEQTEETPIPDPVPTTEETADAGEIADALARFVKSSTSAVNASQVEEIARKVAREVYESAPAEVHNIEYKIDGETVKPSGTVHKELEHILQIAKTSEVTNKYPYLYGPAGTGKSYSAKQVAEALQVPLYYESQVFQPFEIKGYMDAQGKYVETTFYKAFKNGGVYMLDEMDASAPDALTVLNNALASRVFTFPNGERVEAPSNFYCIGAGNTYGTGADESYSARNALDFATLNRFSPIEIDYDERVEKTLTDDAEILDFIHAIRKGADRAGVRMVASYRDIMGLDALHKIGSEDDFAVKTTLWKYLDRDDVSMIIGSLPPSNRYTEATKRLYNLV